MVLAAGLGTRLRPLTYYVSKPMVPVVDRPIMARIVALLERHGFEELICNLHYFPDPIRDYFGDRLAYSFEEELLGTAGGVRNCREFFGGETFVVISGDALTDIDLSALVADHRRKGGVATLAVKEVADTRRYGVVVHDGEGRVVGFQEKPDPAEARSRLGNCGIYVFEPEIFSYFPERPFVDFAQDVFPALLAAKAPFYVHPVSGYWNDIGSLEELRRGSFDVIAGKVATDLAVEPNGGGVLVGEGVELGEELIVEGEVVVCAGAQIGSATRLTGPLIVGPRARIGERASLREAVVMPGAEVPAGGVVVGGIVADGQTLANPLVYAPSAA